MLHRVTRNTEQNFISELLLMANTMTFAHCDCMNEWMNEMSMQMTLGLMGVLYMSEGEPL